MAEPFVLVGQNFSVGFRLEPFSALTEWRWSAVRRRQWYEAQPPLCVPGARLTPVDYCGRYLMAHTPDTVRFGFVVVAIGGASIDAFDEDKCEAYYASSPDWLRAKMDAYGRNPYRRLVDMAAWPSGAVWSKAPCLPPFPMLAW